MIRRFASLPIVCVLTLCGIACGSKHGSGLGGGGSGDGEGALGASSDDGGSGGNGFNENGGATGGFVNLPADGGLGAGTCAASVNHGEQQNLDVYIMLDQSASMAFNNKWTGVTQAITSFVQQPLMGVSVGIQYFGLNFADCTASDYATPEVEIAPLPGVGPKITASLAMHAPLSGTPTLAAEQGAIQHLQDWSKTHPGDVLAVILATDGDPDACNILPTPVAPVSAAAMAGFTGTPSIPTFVIGVGTDTGNLNAIAMAGGTGSAFIVDTSMSVNNQFLDALNKIRGKALGCQYKIPAPMPGAGTVDFSKVNVQFTAQDGTKSVFPQVADKAACPSSGNAWYYDDGKNPTQIILCTSACGSIGAGGTVDILTGCATIFK